MTEIEKAAEVLYLAAEDESRHDEIDALLNAIYDKMADVAMGIQPGDVVFELDESLDN